MNCDFLFVCYFVDYLFHFFLTSSNILYWVFFIQLFRMLLFHLRFNEFKLKPDCARFWCFYIYLFSIISWFIFCYGIWTYLEERTCMSSCRHHSVELLSFKFSFKMNFLVIVLVSSFYWFRSLISGSIKRNLWSKKKKIVIWSSAGLVTPKKEVIMLLKTSWKV